MNIGDQLLRLLKSREVDVVERGGTIVVRKPGRPGKVFHSWPPNRTLGVLLGVDKFFAHPPIVKGVRRPWREMYGEGR